MADVVLILRIIITSCTDGPRPAVTLAPLVAAGGDPHALAIPTVQAFVLEPLVQLPASHNAGHGNQNSDHTIITSVSPISTAAHTA